MSIKTKEKTDKKSIEEFRGSGKKATQKAITWEELVGKK